MMLRPLPLQRAGGTQARCSGDIQAILHAIQIAEERPPLANRRRKVQQQAEDSQEEYDYALVRMEHGMEGLLGLRSDQLAWSSQPVAKR